MAAIVSSRVDELLARCRRDVDEGTLPSCQVAVALDGEIVAEDVFGAATLATRYAVFSSTKPFVASAMWQLIAEGLVDPARPVADYISEFSTNGKDVITVEQVMLHTSGFPAAPMGPPDWSTSVGRRRVFEKWRLNWQPGTAFEYHPTSAHWVLAEIITEVTGNDFRDEIQRRVTEPIGLPRVLGIAPHDQHDIALLEVRGEPPTPDELEKSLGIRALPVTEVTDEALLGFNHQDTRAVGVPGGGGVMRARDLALFYQALLHNRAGLWDASLLEDVTSRVRNTFPDPMLGVSANRSLGLVIAGGDGKSNLRGMGHAVSARAFGHNGAAGQIAWADPETGLSFGYCTNGIDANVLRQWRRGSAVASRAAMCTTPL
jgi:CubicO group peptidase (beta-lactamase class C family)